MTEPEITAYEQVTRAMVEQLAKEFTQHQERLNGNLENIWTELKDLRNRPPVWMTLMFSGSWAIVGAALAYLLKGG